MLIDDPPRLRCIDFLSWFNIRALVVQVVLPFQECQ
jgi:hypothetical protein